ncbi:Saccharopine dehydrogenase NADP binding domain-containing protein [Streptosporangium canum]|uniref:Saccharopine dehydrogenase NADP binding domain-containing protein n=1 Tax=Streptosporangium canum TaxID=324952 RepID=A0A1I3JGV4_9ACTN|nr:saccharopine dehydrogenase NADP-binding domain-containing protein [Streptosporangium canum]SFI59469.1 Saccharopine dehydrogenase NADP binding domain-containing protein [Streptosporangium canum]
MRPGRGAPVIAVLGCYGAVGGSVVRRLREAGAGPLRLGGRDLDRVRALIGTGAGGPAGAEAATGGAVTGTAVPDVGGMEARAGADEAVAVDLRDAAALAAFCEGCHVVVNCAGPSSRILDTVARAALAAGAHYVDVAGDAAVRDRLAAAGLPAGSTVHRGSTGQGSAGHGSVGHGSDGHGSAGRSFDGQGSAGRGRAGRDDAGRVVVLSAGMMPGLSALLPRHLAGQGFDRVDRLTAHVGGVDRFTPAAALDYVASLSDGYATPLAVWRGHQVIPRASRPRRGVELPHFPGRVNAYPYLSAEAERLARSLGFAEVEWSSVFDGELTLAALARLHDLDADTAAGELVRTSRLEAFGRTPYFQMVFRMEGEAAGRPVTRTLVARAADSYELSAAVAVLAAGAVLRGLVRPGLHDAADVLDAGAVFQALLDDPAVTRLEVVDGVAPAVEVEEGVL